MSQEAACRDSRQVRTEGIRQLARIAGAKFGGPLLPFYFSLAYDPVTGANGSCSVGESSSALLLLLGLPAVALLGTRRRGQKHQETL